MSSRRVFAFFCPQGNLAQSVWPQRMGDTAENGGQLYFVLDQAKALTDLGHSVDIYARNYGTEDYGGHGRTLVETVADYPDVRIIHVPTDAPSVVEKEGFYPYYPQWLEGAAAEFIKHDYDCLVGHYADGMFLATCAEEILFRHDGRRRTLLGVTHSLGTEKRDTLIASTGADIGSGDRAEILLTPQFNANAAKYNIDVRLGVEGAALSRMDAMIPVSKDHYKRLYNGYAYPERRMRTIPGGFHPDVFYPLDEDKGELRRRLAAGLDIDDASRRLLLDSKLIVGHGRLVRAKGVVNAVKSLEILLRKHPQVAYMYIGGKPPFKGEEERAIYRDVMDFSRQKGYENRIYFPGSKRHHEINEWLNAADMYLHAASLEPYGLSPLEAAATRVPVVVSKVAGVCDDLENNEHALHVDPHDPGDIAKQVSAYLDNPRQASRIAKAGHKIARMECTWPARADQFLEFMDETEDLYLPERKEAKSAIDASGSVFAARATDLVLKFNMAGSDVTDVVKFVLASCPGTKRNEAWRTKGFSIV